MCCLNMDMEIIHFSQRKKLNFLSLTCCTISALLFDEGDNKTEDNRIRKKWSILIYFFFPC